MLTEYEMNQAAALLQPSRIVVGTVSQVRFDGVPLVDFVGNDDPPRMADRIASLDPNAIGAACRVLLVFPENSERPIIIALLSDHDPQREPAPRDNKPSTHSPRESHGNRSTSTLIEADREIELRCGKSSMVLRHDGKILIKGEQIVSRANQMQRILGGSIQIN